MCAVSPLTLRTLTRYQRPSEWISLEYMAKIHPGTILGISKGKKTTQNKTKNTKLVQHDENCNIHYRNQYLVYF